MTDSGLEHGARKLPVVCDWRGSTGESVGTTALRVGRQLDTISGILGGSHAGNWAGGAVGLFVMNCLNLAVEVGGLGHNCNSTLNFQQQFRMCKYRNLSVVVFQMIPKAVHRPEFLVGYVAGAMEQLRRIVSRMDGPREFTRAELENDRIGRPHQAEDDGV